MIKYILYRSANKLFHTPVITQEIGKVFSTILKTFSNEYPISANYLFNAV